MCGITRRFLALKAPFFFFFFFFERKGSCPLFYQIQYIYTKAGHFFICLTSVFFLCVVYAYSNVCGYRVDQFFDVQENIATAVPSFFLLLLESVELSSSYPLCTPASCHACSSLLALSPSLAWWAATHERMCVRHCPF